MSDLNLPKQFIPIYNAAFFRGYYRDYEITDIQIQDILTALSDERDRFDTASKELDRVHKEARDARDDAKIAWAAVRIANEDKRELNAELERLREVKDE